MFSQSSRISYFIIGFLISKKVTKELSVHGLLRIQTLGYGMEDTEESNQLVHWSRRKVETV